MNRENYRSDPSISRIYIIYIYLNLLPGITCGANGQFILPLQLLGRCVSTHNGLHTHCLHAVGSDIASPWPYCAYIVPFLSPLTLSTLPEKINTATGIVHKSACQYTFVHNSVTTIKSGIYCPKLPPTRNSTLQVSSKFLPAWLTSRRFSGDRKPS